MMQINMFSENDEGVTDKINHSSHYTTGKIEAIEVIEDQKLDFHLGNAFKYLVRAGHKDPDTFVEDLQKAIWYLKRRIELHKAFMESREAIKPNAMNPTQDKNSRSTSVIPALNLGPIEKHQVCVETAIKDDRDHFEPKTRNIHHASCDCPQCDGYEMKRKVRAHDDFNGS